MSFHFYSPFFYYVITTGATNSTGGATGGASTTYANSYEILPSFSYEVETGRLSVAPGGIQQVQNNPSAGWNQNRTNYNTCVFYLLK